MTETESPIIENAKSDLTEPQIALICYYIEKAVTKDNQHQIAKDFGFKGKDSGINQDYLIFCSADRKAVDDNQTKRKNKNKIKLFEKVIDWLKQNNHLSEAKRTKDELDTIISKKDKDCN